MSLLKPFPFLLKNFPQWNKGCLSSWPGCRKACLVSLLDLPEFMLWKERVCFTDWKCVLGLVWIYRSCRRHTCLNDGPLIVTVLQFSNVHLVQAELIPWNYIVSSWSGKEGALGCPVNKTSELSLILKWKSSIPLSNLFIVNFFQRSNLGVCLSSFHSETQFFYPLNKRGYL